MFAGAHSVRDIARNRRRCYRNYVHMPVHKYVTNRYFIVELSTADSNKWLTLVEFRLKDSCFGGPPSSPTFRPDYERVASNFRCVYCGSTLGVRGMAPPSH